MAIMKLNGWDKPGATVTASFEVSLKRVTPFELLKVTS